MFQIHFSDVSFAQASKYVMIVKTSKQTKRSQLCSLWTSVPRFAEPVILDSLQSLVVKACTATLDRKLTVIGSFKINTKELAIQNQIIFQDNKNFTNMIQDKQLCIGRCTIKIVKVGKKFNQKDENYQVDSFYELKSESESQQGEKEEQQPQCKLKFIIHGGFDFYLNAGFKVKIKWGTSSKQTKLVSNRIAPFWGQCISLEGKQNKIVEIVVEDDRKSKLEWLKLNPKDIRIMYPYHLHIYFREQYMGLPPHFFITIIREDVPLFSILDRKINIKVRYVGPAAPQSTQQYLLIYPQQLQCNQASKLPIFIDLYLQNYISFANVNKMIQRQQARKYQWSNWNLLIPINVHVHLKTQQQFSLLKSFINKSLVCMYFSLEDSKSLFLHQTWNNVSILDRKQCFENSIKQLYYQQKKIVLGKAVELTNLDTENIQNEKNSVSLQQKWKILTHNYILRKKLLSKSIQSIEQLKKQIKSKGQYLEQLKKILIEVRKMNLIMTQKQKSSLIENGLDKKIKDNFGQYKTIQIVTMLLEKQVQLQKRKKINDQMRMRMDSLHYFNQDSQQLDKIVVENAQKLLQQQMKMKQMKKMNETIPKQRQIIVKLQRMFQKREVDKEMNDLLQRQQSKLGEMKKVNNKSLQVVYNMVRQHRNAPNSLLQNIKAAQGELISLNAQYAKITTL